MAKKAKSLADTPVTGTNITFGEVAAQAGPSLNNIMEMVVKLSPNEGLAQSWASKVATGLEPGHSLNAIFSNDEHANSLRGSFAEKYSKLTEARANFDQAKQAKESVKNTAASLKNINSVPHVINPNAGAEGWEAWQRGLKTQQHSIRGNNNIYQGRAIEAGTASPVIGIADLKKLSAEGHNLSGWRNREFPDSVNFSKAPSPKLADTFNKLSSPSSLYTTSAQNLDPSAHALTNMGGRSRAYMESGASNYPISNVPLSSARGSGYYSHRNDVFNRDQNVSGATSSHGVWDPGVRGYVDPSSKNIVSHKTGLNSSGFSPSRDATDHLRMANQYDIGRNADFYRNRNVNSASRVSSYSYDASALGGIPKYAHDFVNKISQKPQEGSVLSIIDRVTKGGGKGGGVLSPSDGSHSGGGGHGGGFMGQIGQQFRHAAIWQMYTPILGAAAGYAYGATSPFASKAASELQGYGATTGDMHAALNLGYASYPEDPFRHPQQSIITNKRIISAFGMEPNVPGQLEAFKLAKHMQIASKATEMKEEPLIQITSRVTHMLRDHKMPQMEQASRVLSAFTKGGQLTDVLGQELTQSLQQGGSAMATLFKGHESPAAAAIALAVPFITKGVPNFGRAMMHMVKPATQEKMARAQVMAEVNKDRMEAHGGNLAYAMTEKEYKKSLKKNPEWARREQEVRQEINAAKTPQKITNVMARYGRQLAWSAEYGVSIPSVDTVMMRAALAANEMEGTPEARAELYKQMDMMMGSYKTNSIEEDRKKVQPVDTTSGYAAQIQKQLENSARTNKAMYGAAKIGSYWFSDAGVRSQVTNITESKHYSKEDKKAQLEQLYESFDESVKQGYSQIPKGMSSRQYFGDIIQAQVARTQGEEYASKHFGTIGNIAVGAFNIPGLSYVADIGVHAAVGSKKGQHESYGFDNLGAVPIDQWDLKPN